MKQPVPSPEASSTVTNPHDKTFKFMFKKKEVAEDVIRVNLPDEVVANLDFSTMTLADSSFVSKELAETFSDVLYRVRTETHRMYICFLFEHKSTSDKFASLQVAQYIIDLWHRILQETNELPVVVPIVFYHGKAPWKYSTDLRELIFEYAQLAAFYQDGLPVMTHQLIDMHEQDEEFIEQYNELTQLIVLVFKYIFIEIELLLEILFIHLEKVRRTMSEEQFMDYVSQLLFYIEHANPGFSDEVVDKKIKELEGRGVITMSILERRERRGMEKGLATGIKEGIKEGTEKTRRENARNFLEMGLDIEIVAEGTGLTVERVKKIQAKLNDQSN